MQNSITGNCCDGISVETPVMVHNRPSLKAVSYRVGNYHQFRESLLAKLSTAHLAALRRLTTRSTDDFTIALLDAWAIVSDVLTFYQERIANESYLETATELRSVLELARLIGYELRPGVAASTYVAFTLEAASLSASQAIVSGIAIGKEEPPLIQIEKGTKAQSIPGPNEKPQVFETVEKVEAKAAWNAIKVRTSQPQNKWTESSRADNSDHRILLVQGINNNLKKGDVLLFVHQQDETKKDLKKIHQVEIDQSNQRTLIYFDDSKTASFQSYDLPNISQPTGASSVYPDETPFTVAAAQLINETWSEENFLALLREKNWSALEVEEAIQMALSTISYEFDVFVFRKMAYPFGYNAPKKLNFTTPGVPVIPLEYTEWAIDNEQNNGIYLDATYQEILPGSYIAIQKPGSTLDASSTYQIKKVDIYPRTAYGISAKSTLISIRINDDSNWWGANSEDFGAIRNTTIYAQSEALILAQTPIITGIEKGATTIELSQLYLGLKKGKAIILSGERVGLPGIHASEVRFLKNVVIAKGFTVIELDKPLAFSYVRRTVTINANVALATHGETVKEILGSGDASSIFQKFRLKQPPLTFTSAATPSGTVSTLEIRVNDILWKEVPSLYGRGPNEQIYITRQNDAGQTTVIFGDGITGARLPSGQQNIQATYRKGIGSEALVKSHQLSQLLTRPLGVKAITNPLPSSGAQDRERLANARHNANLTVSTIDRIVSLQDYEDFARAFAGISKAKAIWIRSGRKRFVHLTIAGYQGALVSTDSQLYKNLQKAIQNAGIPNVPVTIASYERKSFQVAASIQVHPDYLPDKVLRAVEQVLRDHFSFSQRQFGQSVALSEVFSIMQMVAGVVAVDVDALYIKGEAVKQNPSLPARIPRSGLRTTENNEQQMPKGAELVTIDTGPLDLKIVL